MTNPLTMDEAARALAPVRLQLSRRKGFNLQQLSHETNGLWAVNASRPGKWGNPYIASPAVEDEHCSIPEITTETAVTLFRSHLESRLTSFPSMRDSLAELRGKNLACWCKPGEPCHADVLLELANA